MFILLSYSYVSNWQKLQVTFLLLFSSTDILKMSFMSWLYRFDRCSHPLQSLWEMCILSYKKSRGAKEIGKNDHFLYLPQVFSCYPGVFQSFFWVGWNYENYTEICQYFILLQHWMWGTGVTESCFSHVSDFSTVLWAEWKKTANLFINF